MSEMASQISGGSIVSSIVCSGADQRRPMDSSHKGPVKRKYFHLMTSSCSHAIYGFLTAGAPGFVVINF